MMIMIKVTHTNGNKLSAVVPECEEMSKEVGDKCYSTLY